MWFNFSVEKLVMLCLVFGVKVGDVMMMVGNLILLIDGVLVVLLVSE